MGHFIYPKGFVRGGYKSKPKTESNKQLTKEVKSLQKKVRNLKPELKWYDGDVADGTSANSTAVSYSGTVFPLTLLVDGTGENNRTGTQIAAKKIEVKVLLETNYTSTVPINQPFKVALILDRFNTGSTPAISDIYNTATFNATDMNWMCYPNINKNLRFKVLKEKHVVLNNQGSASGATGTVVMGLDTSTRFLHFKKSLKSKKWKYSADATGTSNYGPEIFLVAIASTNSNDSFLSYTSRFTFTDI